MCRKKSLIDNVITSQNSCRFHFCGLFMVCCCALSLFASSTVALCVTSLYNVVYFYIFQYENKHRNLRAKLQYDCPRLIFVYFFSSPKVCCNIECPG